MEINGYPITMFFWNIFLLLVPLFFFILLSSEYKKTKFKKTKQKMVGAFLFFLWLLFIPNSAYVITDVRHLIDYCPSESFYNVCVSNAWVIIFFFVYSVLGWIAFVIFLRDMKGLVKKVFNKKISTIFIIVIIPLIALGVLLGLLNRFDSWEIFIHPLAIFKSMLVYITHFKYFINLLVFTVGLYILYFLGVFLFKNKINYDRLFKGR